MKNVLVSKCLLGFPCRYDGKVPDKKLELDNDICVLGVCPEVMGGLDTPRIASEIVSGDGFDVLDGKAKVINKAGEDVTEQFVSGAYKVLEIAKENGITTAILKAKSPSCGCGKIYDGTFTRTLREGVGVTCALLLRNGINVKTE